MDTSLQPFDIIIAGSVIIFIIAANDGEAFDFHEKIKTGGLGLKNIISRIESMDAEWSVPTLNEGFEIKIIINE
jgi:signal transduction histidine kinase